MDLIFNLLTATTLMAGGTDTTAFQQQATNGAQAPAITMQVSPGSSGAYASARVPGVAGGYIRNNAVAAPSQTDFQLGGR